MFKLNFALQILQFKGLFTYTHTGGPNPYKIYESKLYSSTEISGSLSHVTKINYNTSNTFFN